MQSTPRRVAIPLMKAVKGELQRMEKLGVIAKVNEPTAWCAGMVVVPKANGKVRICVDLTRLNQSMRREKHPLPAVEPTLAQLAGARVFTKLDAQSQPCSQPSLLHLGDSASTDYHSGSPVHQSTFSVGCLKS